MGYCLVCLSACFSEQARGLKKMWGKQVKFDHSQSVDVLGVEYHASMDKTIVDMAYSMLEMGTVPDKRENAKNQVKP